MKRLSPLVVIVTMACLTPAWGQVLNDPLNGSTIGTRQNGAFVTGGWQVTNQYDTIYWHIANYSKGAFEYNVKGIGGPACSGGNGDKNELSHMYDWTFGNSDLNYSGGYRDGPHKQFIRKQCYSPKIGTLEILWSVPPSGNFTEADTSALSWDSATNYLWRTEWENVGGNAILRIYRDGVQIFTNSRSGTWSPGGHSVRIASSPRRGNEGAHVGAIYSNVKVWNLTGAIPNAPTITAPASGETVNTQVVYIQWSGDSHSRYQVRVNTQNNPDAGIVSDTGQVDTGRYFTWSGTLPNNTTCYAFVRLGSSTGWGAWSAGRSFTVNTAFVPSGTDFVRVNGNSYRNFSGPFLGLGFTHMRAMQRCKFDRPRYESDLSYMASKKFTYQRDLTMVDWKDLEIAPVTFTNKLGQTITAWSDYWQQFRDHIDLAYSNGIKTEITIFAGAQYIMPAKSTRQTHINNVLGQMPGREHKVVLIEVANEGYQNGFPGSTGEADMREFCQTLANGTAIPVSISAAQTDETDPGIIQLYSGSAADIVTVHFSRDIGTIEGGWKPVRDSYRTGLGALPPVSSNEPIGPGSSVNTENDPIKLVMAGCFAWNANLISYVLHSRAGVYSWTGCCPPSGTEVFFSSTPGTDNFDEILPFLPKELSSWERNDGKAGPSPFTSYSMGQANKWWPEVSGSTNGCVRNISAIKNGRFVTTPIGILSGGLQVQARRPMQFKAYNPLTGGISYNQTLATGVNFTLAQGTGAYVIIGDFTDVPIDPGGGGGLPGTLTVKPAGTITVDGNSSDWVLGDFVTKSRGGEGTTGDIALVGFDGGSTVYRGAYVGVLPTNAADHTAKVYSRQNATYQYFLVRLDDNQRQTPNATAMNWANDCVEFYIDPSNDGGSVPMSNSTSDIQLVIDAINQKNVYATTTGYATQVLAGVTSAVTTDANGWWLEVRITKSALDPDLPSIGIFGLDFNFRDNDNSNDPALTTVYTWSESSTEGFPSKIPGHWGDAAIQQAPFGGSARAIPGIIQSEDFDIGGEGVAYHDTDAPNNGGQYRTSEGVDIETCTDTGGGFDIGWNMASEWQEYTVNVNTTGDYAIKLRLSSATSGGSFHLDLDGVALTSIKSMSGTGGWQTWTTIIVPGIFMSAGNNRILRFTVDTPDIGINMNYMDFAFGGADVVSEDLGTTNSDDGMTHPQPADGDTAGASIGGHNCRNNVNAAEDFYMYFTVADIYAFQGNKNNAAITVDYYDTGTTSINLQYDGTPGAYTQGPTVALTNTNTWKTTVFNVGDAYFGNRQNNGADFRFYGGATTFYFDTVMVFSSVGGSPPGAASNPNPANGATLVVITTDPSWTAGSNAASHDVRFGTVNPPPFVVNQTSTTYAAPTLSPNTLYYWRIDEVNTSGTTTGTVWSFTTLPLPGAASAPNPANGATGVATNATLSWTAGSNAASHDVRFGTANPPPFVVNQTGTTYNPGTLANSTTYFWRIDEVNSSGTTTGTVWSFTTVSVAQGPYGGTARAIPGLIQAEDYDTGGEDIAYNDNDVGNNGGAYRTDNVDIEATTDTGGGFNVGWTGTGEWLEYTVNVNTTGDYAIKLRVASGGAGGTFSLSIDGSNIATGKSFAGTGGWQTWTTVIVPGIFLSSGNNKILRLTVDAGDPNVNSIDFTFGGADVVSIDLAATNILDGMDHPPVGDGDTVAATIGGHNCRKNSNAADDFYMYFSIADIYAFQGSKNNATITVDYYDTGTTSINLQYDGTPGAYTQGATVALTNTNTWKTNVFNVTNAYFGNRQNSGADFRISAPVGVTFYLDTVMVFATVGGPVTLNNSAFPSNADGWNIVVWRSNTGEFGTMDWNNADGNPAASMLSVGKGTTNNADSCTREGGELNKVISTAGYSSIQVQYDLKMSTDQTGTNCTGNCVSAVLEGNCADKIAVYYSTAGTGGPWTLLEAVNALSITQNVWSTRTINCPAGANNQANFALRFRFQFNRVNTDLGRLDNIKVIGTP